MTLTPFTRRVFVALAWLAAVTAVVATLADVLLTSAIGVDFFPVRNAGRALLSWQSVYTDRTFVYPPSSAPLFTPLALGSDHQAFVGWTFVLAAAQVVAAVLIVRITGHRIRTVVVPLVVLTGHVFALVLGISNVTLLLVPVAVAIVGSFHRGRWTLGCALLAASLLVKPLLIALVLVPLVYRKFRALTITMVPATAVLLISMAIVPGGTNIGRFVGYVLSGTNLRGKHAMLNLSIAGWGETHGVPDAVVLVGRLAVVAVCAAVSIRVARANSPLGVAQLALVACLTAMLAGRLSENHFLLPVIALALLRLGLAPTTRALALYGPPLAMLYVSPRLVPGVIAGPAGNNWFVAAELLLFAAAAAELWTSRSAQRRTPRAGARNDRTPDESGRVVPDTASHGPVVPAVAGDGKDRGEHGDVVLARVAADDA